MTRPRLKVRVPIALFALVWLCPARVPAQDRPVAVTSDSSFRLQAWRIGGSGFEKVWEARPRAGDPALRERRRAEAVPLHAAPPVLADVDGDGRNDLVVADGLGVTVYGRAPAYYPFAVASTLGGVELAVGDADADGAAEIVTHRLVAGARVIEVSRSGARGLAGAWQQTLPGTTVGPIALEDIDNDGRREILVAGGDTITVLALAAGPTWEVRGELPTFGIVMALSVADVDGDGRKEVLAGDSTGRISIFKARKSGSRFACPVMWQSPSLAAGLAAPQVGTAFVQVLGLAAGDLDGDGRPEIAAVTRQWARVGDRDHLVGQLQIFGVDERKDIVRRWASDPIDEPTALSAGDVDGDGVSEILFNGRQIYRHDAATNGYRVAGTLGTGGTGGVIGAVGDLQEPVSATRVLAALWSPFTGEIAEGQTLDVSLTLSSVWAEARDVTVAVTSANPRLSVAGAPVRIASIPPGGNATTAPVRVTAGPGTDAARLVFEITAAGGYRQTVPAAVYVSAPLPTYEPNAAAQIADALGRARKGNRRVLVLWGANGDRDSQELVLTTSKSADVTRTLLYDYEVVRADVGEAGAIPSRYRAKGAAPTLPTLSVLAADGRVLDAQPARAFAGMEARATGGGVRAPAATVYDSRRMNEFLSKYKPVYEKAGPLFTEALSRARREDKVLFLWFSAPW